jgi:hypothetical protein
MIRYEASPGFFLSLKTGRIAGDYIQAADAYPPSYVARDVIKQTTSVQVSPTCDIPGTG